MYIPLIFCKVVSETPSYFIDSHLVVRPLDYKRSYVVFDITCNDRIQSNKNEFSNFVIGVKDRVILGR